MTVSSLFWKGGTVIDRGRSEHFSVTDIHFNYTNTKWFPNITYSTIRSIDDINSTKLSNLPNIISN